MTLVLVLQSVIAVCERIRIIIAERTTPKKKQTKALADSALSAKAGRGKRLC